MGKHRTRIAVALISAVTIALELALMRALSLRFWHHFSSLIIATALLGFGAGGTLLTLFRRAIAGRRQAVLFAASALMALAVPAAVRAADRVDLNVQFLTWDAFQVGRLAAIELIFMVPLLLGGLCVGVALMDEPDRLAGHYAASLIGSGAGAGGAIVLMQFLPLPQVVAALSVGALAAAASAAPWRRLAGAGLVAVVAGGCVAVHWLSPWTPAVSQYKALANALRMPDTEVIARAEGPLGRIDVVAGPAIHALPTGRSLACPVPTPEAALIITDADQAAAVYRTGGAGGEYEFMDWTTSALPYRLRRRATVLILGAGGGEQIGLASYHQSPRIVAVEMNPQVIELMRGPLRELGGAIYDAPNVRVLNRQPRGYLAGSDEKFDLIQLQVGGSAASGAGVEAGSESFLFTVEAFEAMLDRLAPGGMMCVTCPSLEPPRAELRLLDIAAVALRGRGHDAPDERVIVIRGYDAVSVLILDAPIAQAQARAVADFCEAREFNVSFMSASPGRELPSFHSSAADLGDRVEAILGIRREAFLRDYVFNVAATTDDRPYFYNFFRFRAQRHIFQQLGRSGRSYLEIGYVLLLAAVAQLVPVAAVLIVLPLAGRARGLWARRGKLRAFGYFSAIGVGFMFLEMMFLQRLTVYLAHPIYSAAAVIGVFLVFAGLGSRLSQWPKAPPQTIICRAGLAVAALALLHVLGLKHLLAATQGWPLGARAAVAVVALAPLAVAMGHMFPTALRSLSGRSPQLVPWCWAINGFASVVAAVGAKLLAMEIGFTMLALAAAAMYVLAFAVWRTPARQVE